MATTDPLSLALPARADPKRRAVQVQPAQGEARVIEPVDPLRKVACWLASRRFRDESLDRLNDHPNTLQEGGET